jgi:hypothetical protein
MGLVPTVEKDKKHSVEAFDPDGCLMERLSAT